MKRIKILFLFSNLIEADYIIHELKKCGIELTGKTVNNRESFLKKYIVFQPDLVIADVKLCGITEIKLLKNSGLPVILAVDQREEALAAEYMNYGVDDYFLKNSLLRIPFIIKRILRDEEIESERKLTTTQLETSQSLYKTIVDTMNEGLMFLNKHGFIQIVNHQLCKLTGYSEDELIGKPGEDFLISTENIKEIKNLKKNENHVAEIKIRKKDGTEFNARFSSSTIYNLENEITGIVETIFDITENKNYEKEIEKNKKQYQLLFEHNPMPMWVYDDESLKFLEVNEAAQKKYGYSREEFLSMTIKDIRPEEEIPKLLDDLINNSSGYATGVFFKHLTKDKQVLDVEIKGHDILFNGKRGRLILSTDFTEKIKAENALKFSEEKFRTIYESAPVGIALISPDGRIQKANDTLSILLGFTESEFQTKMFQDLTYPSDLEELLAVLKRFYDKNFNSIQTEKRYVKKDGNVIWTILTISAIRNEQKEIDYFIAIIEDITDIKTAAEEIKKLANFPNEIKNPVLRISSKGRILFANKASNYFVDHLNFKNGVVNKEWKNFVEETFEKNEPAEKEIKVNGQVYTVSATPVPSENYINIFALNITDKKHTESALLESEKSYRELFNSVSESIYIQDSEGKFLDVNESVLKMYGYSKEELIGQTPAMLAAPGLNDIEETLRKAQLAFEGKTQAFEWWGRRKNGEIFPKDIILNKGRYFGRDVIIVTARDITERKNAERILRESERKFKRTGGPFTSSYF